MRNFDFSSWQSILTTLVGLALFTLISIGIRLLMMFTIQQRRERMNRQINERLRTLIAAYKVLGGSFTGNLSVDPTHLRDVRLRSRAAASGAVEAARGSGASASSIHDETESHATRAAPGEEANAGTRPAAAVVVGAAGTSGEEGAAAATALTGGASVPAGTAGAPANDAGEDGSERQRRIRDAAEAALSDIILLGTEEQVRLAQRAVGELVAGRRVETHDLVVSLRDFIRVALDLAPIPADLPMPRQGPARPSSGPSRGAGRGEGGNTGGGRGGGAGGGMGGGMGGGGMGGGGMGGSGMDNPGDPPPTGHRL